MLRMYRNPVTLGWALDPEFNGGKAPKDTGLAAVCWYTPTSATDTNASQLVYWQNDSGRIVETKQINGTWTPPNPVTKPIMKNTSAFGKPEIYRTKLSAVQFESGQSIRLCHQGAENRIFQQRRDNGVWVEGGPLPA